MTIPIIAAKLRAVDHRTIWWLLSRQERIGGVPTGAVAPGWRKDALRDLEVSFKTLCNAVRRLHDAGIIDCPKRRRTCKINGDAFR